MILATAFLVIRINQALNRADQQATVSKRENRQLQTSIMALLEAVDEVSEGDLSVRAPVTEGALGNVADALNQMLDQLASVLTETTELAQNIQDGLENVVQANRSVALGATKQSENIIQTSNRMQTISGEMETVSLNASDANGAAGSTMASAERGAKSVSSVILAMQELRGSVQDGAKKVKGLGDRSMEITDIVSVIAKISDQTNMLALNAAIEAARAGEEGKGFSVVADQVQRLAERTASATEEIAELVRYIQEDAGASVQAIDEQSAAVERESLNVSEAGKILEEIVAHLVNHQTLWRRLIIFR